MDSLNWYFFISDNSWEGVVGIIFYSYNLDIKNLCLTGELDWVGFGWFSCGFDVKKIYNSFSSVLNYNDLWF